MNKRFTGHTRLFLCISGAIIVVALIMQICGAGLNLGIDFTGGSILEYSVGENYDDNDVKMLLSSVGYESAQVTKAAPSAASINLQQRLADEAAAKAAEEAEQAAEETTEAAAETAEAAEEVVDAAEETPDATDAPASEEGTEASEETEQPGEEASDATADPEETSGEAASKNEEAAEDETAEEASAAPLLLDQDKSGIKADGLTDLQIRLRLVDTAAGMQSCVSDRVTAEVPGSSLLASSQLTYQAITQNSYDTSFTGGYLLDFDMGTADLDVSSLESAIRDALDQGGYSINALQLIPYAPEGSEEETGLRVLVDLNDATSQVRSVLEREMSAKYPGFHFISIDHVSAIAGRDLLSNAVKALLIAFALMLVYIAIRFSPLSGLTAMLALLHDVLIMMSFMVFFRWRFQVNSSFIAAVLTIVGYSINNTIIIFDRIREDQKRPGFTQKPRMEIVEMSVASTLSRTINTTITTLITLVALYILGVESIKQFGFPLIVGMLAGTYSSVLLSGQVWAMFSEKYNAYKAAKKA